MIGLGSDKKDQERQEFWGLSITDARFWFAGTISRELALMLNIVQLCTRDDGYQDDDEVLANVIYDDYRVIVVVHQDLLHSKCILEQSTLLNPSFGWNDAEIDNQDKVPMIDTKII